jgi:hypothetical protein
MKGDERLLALCREASEFSMVLGLLRVPAFALKVNELMCRMQLETAVRH